MKAVVHHTQDKMIILYIKRWLKASIITEEGEEIKREKGVPQGGIVSPLLMNLFLHYVFDKWVEKHYPFVEFARYADDAVVHCRSLHLAKRIRKDLEQRFKECKLELHPKKTKIVYCFDDKRKGEYKERSFDFLGYTFRPRRAKRKTGEIVICFSPAVSKSAIKSMRAKLRSINIRQWENTSLEEVSKQLNPILRGWQKYYCKFYASAIRPVYISANKQLVRWAKHKYKNLRTTSQGIEWLIKVSKANPKLFVHWESGMRQVLLSGSRMN